MSSSVSAEAQDFGDDPTNVRETDHYNQEYIQSFVEKWDELIDWDARAESEGRFFIDILKARGKARILDVATGTGLHSVQLLEADFDVTSVDGNAEMLTKAFNNAREHEHVLNTTHADWRFLNRDVHSKYDAIIDRGYKSQHQYYCCGDQVSVAPEHVDDGLARFRYEFPDGSVYRLNMFPLRKRYMRRLFTEAGFQKIKTYGDFQESYEDYDPDFFIHVAEKTYESK